MSRLPFGARGDIAYTGARAITSRARGSAHKLKLNPVCRARSASQTENFLDAFIVMSDLLSLVACWKRICSGVGQDVAPEERLSASIYSRAAVPERGCQPAASGAPSSSSKQAEHPSKEMPGGKKTGG